MTRRFAGISVALACAIGFGLRIHGLGYGLPAVYNPDEVAIMNRALVFGTGTFNPGNFLYPTLYFYLLFTWEGLTFLVGWAAGLWSSLAGFERQYFLDPTPLFWSGRLLSVLCGTATIAVVYRIGSRLAGRLTGVAAAAALAVAPFAVQDAHYVKHDIPVTLLIALVPLALVGGHRHRLWLAAAAAGLAASTHYYALVVTLIIAAECLGDSSRPWLDRIRRLGLAALVALVVFLAASPYLLPEWRMAWIDITQNRAIVMGRATDEAGAFASLGTYVRWMARWALGGGTGVLAALGLVVAVRQRRTFGALVVFPMAFLLFIANTVPATRYLNPVLPFAAVLFGLIVRELTSRATRWVSLAVIVFLTAPGASDSWRLGWFFNQDDTRTIAQRWIEANVADGSTILLQPYSVPVARNAASLVEALRIHVGDESSASVRFQRELAAARDRRGPSYRVLFLGDGGLDVDKIYLSPGEVAADDSITALRAKGVEWVVLKQYNVSNPSLTALQRVLARDARLAHVVSPFDPAREAAAATVTPFEHNEDVLLHGALARPGPTIQIWHLGESSLTSR